jgi:hypothetical protein
MMVTGLRAGKALARDGSATVVVQRRVELQKKAAVMPVG